MKINKKNLEIKIKEIELLTEKEILNIYIIIKTFVKLEIEKGNGLQVINIEIEYVKNFKTKEYINITKHIVNGYSFDLINFFAKLKDKENIHEDTKIILDTYFESTDKKQKIIVNMLFTCKSNINEMVEKSKLLT